MTAAEATRLAVITLIVITLVEFAPAIVHARDTPDRLYLMGGAVVMVSITIGLFIHLHQPLNMSTPLLVAGLLLWMASALKSRTRRRKRPSRGRRGSA